MKFSHFFSTVFILATSVSGITAQIRGSGNQTGAQVRQDWFKFAAPGLPANRRKVFENLQQKDWDTLADLASKGRAGDKTAVAKVGNAWKDLYAGKAPDFANLSAVLPPGDDGKLRMGA
ncbi:hypothetical protein H072_7177 [Dactylellina haptotyla CBS 200.50]|uniref:Uncharacterized protein n=1 Tax=Dactylellina haptotyla (strain CBS 200.50) TaxID=1284197 RepID=S8BUR9_DACHA|nr:hypothetical protein H072_7177 [Dactylellina haptotyla CBS 200.50]